MSGISLVTRERLVTRMTLSFHGREKLASDLVHLWRWLKASSKVVKSSKNKQTTSANKRMSLAKIVSTRSLGVVLPVYSTLQRFCLAWSLGG
jgi:hypothetical protein